MRVFKSRRGHKATYMLLDRHNDLIVGVTLWRAGAASLLAPFGRDGVPVQIVFGDWWKAHPEVAKERRP